MTGFVKATEQSMHRIQSGMIILNVGYRAPNKVLTLEGRVFTSIKTALWENNGSRPDVLNVISPGCSGRENLV